jgi:hypothetical protein
MKILLILDIDETFLHLVSGRHTIPSDYNYDKLSIDRTSTIYYRPGFAEFMQFAKENSDWLALGIWTYGNQMYADMNYRQLLQKYQLPESLFLLVYSETEIKNDLAYGMFEKDLRRVYEMHPEYNEENTFIVDNRPANIHHMANRQNGIIVESFIPTNIYYNPYQDTVFEDVIQICKKMHQADSPGMSVFHKDHVDKLGLQHLHQLFLIDDDKHNIMAIGNIDEDEYFKAIKESIGFLKGGNTTFRHTEFIESSQKNIKRKKTKKSNGRWRQTRMRNKLRHVVGNRKRIGL